MTSPQIRFREDDGPRWYLARTNAGQIGYAVDNLRAIAGVETFVPMRLAQNRKGEVSPRPLFGNHVFFRLSPFSEGWFKVFSARGVKSIYCAGSHPLFVPEKAIKRIMDEQAPDGLVRVGAARHKPVPDCRFKPGQAVRVAGGAGAMAGFDAIFEHSLDNGRALILLKGMGRDTRVTLELENLT